MRVAVELARRKAGDMAEFDRLDQDAERLDSLVGQILSYTRLDSDDPAEATIVDIGDVISEVVENANFEQKGEKVLEFDESAAAGIGVPGRRGALISGFENVVRNAVRHAPQGSVVRIDVRAEGHQVIVEVSDNGPGVDDDELKHLFDPFFRTRKSLDDGPNDGTGLGLAIARRAVVAHGGTIAAKNDDGLVVTISLPLADAAGAAPASGRE